MDKKIYEITRGTLMLDDYYKTIICQGAIGRNHMSG